MSTPDPSSVTAILAKFRREAERQNMTALRQLGGAYNQLYKRLSEKLELEARRIFEEGGESVSRLWIRQRLASLYDDVRDELTRYAAFLEGIIDSSTDDALALGSRHALELMRFASGGRAGLISVDFNRLNTAQINTIIGFLSPGSALRERIAQMSGYYSQRVMDELIEAIALGYNPYKTAKNITPFLTNVMDAAKGNFASVLAAAVRMARTSQLWTYREATRANYQTNSDVVTGWQWNASLDADTCGSCWAMHGTIHGLDETLDDHHHGRCYMTPVLLGQPLIAEDAGRSRFDSLSEAEQRQILGNGAFEAYRDGKFDFSALSKQVENDVYGTMRTVPSLAELTGDK